MKSPSVMRYHRVQSILAADPSFKAKVAKNDYEVVKKNNERHHIPTLTVAVADEIHRQGKDAGNVPAVVILRTAMEADAKGLKPLVWAEDAPTPKEPKPKKAKTAKPKAKVEVKKPEPKPRSRRPVVQKQKRPAVAKPASKEPKAEAPTPPPEPTPVPSVPSVPPALPALPAPPPAPAPVVAVVATAAAPAPPVPTQTAPATPPKRVRKKPEAKAPAPMETAPASEPLPPSAVPDKSNRPKLTDSNQSSVLVFSNLSKLSLAMSLSQLMQLDDDNFAGFEARRDSVNFLIAEYSKIKDVPVPVSRDVKTAAKASC